MSNIDEKNIVKSIWNVCAILRGNISSFHYMDYIFPLLFLKYISDLTCDLKKGVDIGINAKVSSILSKSPRNVNFYNLYDEIYQGDVGGRINSALMYYDKTIFISLLGCGNSVFDGVNFDSEGLGIQATSRDKFLCDLLEAFNTEAFDFSYERNGVERIEVVCDVFFEIISLDSANRGGVSYTPLGVSNLLTELISPRPGDSIYDPACGTGSLLISSGRKIIKDYESKKYDLFGQESNRSSWALANINMFLHGEFSGGIELGDVLRTPKLLDVNGDLKKFDVVISNPPFSVQNWGYESAINDRFGRFNWGIPPQSKGDYAFISHMIASLKDDTGRMAVIVPHGVLFRGASEGAIRKNLLDANLLDAVIGLPERLFLSTGLPTAILIFKKRRTDSNVIFIDTTNFFENSRGRNIITEEISKEVLNIYQDRKELDNYSHIADLEEIRSNDYNLNITRYIKIINEEPSIDLAVLHEEREKLKSELRILETQMQSFLDY